MNCEKCGMQMPPGSVACPNCGLKIRQAPGAAPPPTAQPMGTFAPGAQGPPPPFDPYANTGSPSDPFAQPGYVRPGEVQHLSPAGGPGAASYKAKGDLSGKMVNILIGAIVLALLVTGVLYFTVIRKSGPSGPGPGATVQKYFAEMSNGNVAGVQALFTTDTVPTEESVRETMSALITCRGSSAKVVNVKLSVSNKTATSATVTVVDMTLTASGKTAKVSDAGPVPKMDLSVVLIGGQWLIDDH
jgi:hypothetical protein